MSSKKFPSLIKDGFVMSNNSDLSTIRFSVDVFAFIDWATIRIKQNNLRKEGIICYLNLKYKSK